MHLPGVLLQIPTSWTLPEHCAHCPHTTQSQSQRQQAATQKQTWRPKRQPGRAKSKGRPISEGQVEGLTSSMCHQCRGHTHRQPNVTGRYIVMGFPLLPRSDGSIRVHDGFGGITRSFSIPAVVLWCGYSGACVPKEIHLQPKSKVLSKSPMWR